ncbi:MAG: aromatic ring-hydroxylating oxygenase subunit alpha [Pseudomonadales bacterium]
MGANKSVPGPGQARCSGLSAKDVVRIEDDGAPAVFLEDSYEFLGDDDIPYARYLDPAFYEREIRTVWAKTWQWACREEQIPNPGDYYVYDVGPYSVIVVRQEEGGVKAFANSCPHRGMQFASAGTSGSGKQFLRCPFHGMSWQLNGELREIPCRWDFPHVVDEDFRLTAVACDLWAGFIFINVDASAPPLADYMEVLPAHLAHYPLEDRYVSMHTHKVLPGNWKMCMEAFMEAFHVMATHPEGAKYTADANANYDLYGRHVSRFMHSLGIASPLLGKSFSEREIVEAMGYDASDMPPGVSARQFVADNMRADFSAALGVDLQHASNLEMLDSIQYFLFPNAFFFPGILLRMVYRFRPLTVDTCIHEILVLDPCPRGQRRPEPAKTVYLDEEASYQSVPGFDFGLVFDQDTDNLKRQRAGMKASLKGAQTLGNYQESRIRHFHRTLDEYLAGE